MSRQRYERGHLKKSDTKPQKWLGEWHVYRKIDGKEKRIHRGPKVIGLVSKMTKGEAQQALDAIISQERGLDDQVKDDPTFADLYNEYVTLKTPHWSASSLRSITYVIPRFAFPVIGKLPTSAVTRPMLQSLLNGLAAKGLSRSLIHKVRVYLKAIFDEALENDRIAGKNPARLLDVPETKEKESRTLTEDECARLMAVTTGRDHLIIRIALMCALRPSELFMLRRDDKMTGAIRIDQGVVRGRIGKTKTKGSRALVNLPPSLEAELDAWLGQNPGESSDLIFPSEDNTPIEENNYRNRVLIPAGELAGIKGLNFQILRRTNATLFQKYGNVKDAQAHLRHASPVTTLTHYQQVIPESLRAAVAAMDERICGVRKEMVQ